MALYDVPAPAKLNLFLHVTGRRADGYHELQTVFRFIDLCDTLNFDLRRDGKLVREGQGMEGLSADHDLVLRAAKTLQQATGTSLGVQIRYTKRIPSGAGLGGGSSDAASTLIALNRLWNTGLSREELMRLALPLGADVPVFIFGRPAFAEGIGDVLTEVSLPSRHYLVLRPKGAISTAQVFSSPDLTRNTKSVIISVFADWQTGQAQEKQGFTRGASVGKDAYCSKPLFGRNDLEPVVRARYQPIDEMAQALRSNGFHARMTGSGNCFFIEFDSLENAYRAQQEISSKMLVGGSERLEGVGNDALEFHQNPLAVVEDIWVCPGLSEHPLKHW